MSDDNSLHFILNNRTVESNANPNMVVLDFLRTDSKLTGTKEGCREGDCGACTVLLGELQNDVLQYRSVNSCLLPLGDIHGKHLLTIEGINPPSGLNPLQNAFVEEGGTQCGFCTPGFLMSFTGYCLHTPKPTEEEAVQAVEGNICRCTGHPPIRRSIVKALEVITHDPVPHEALLERAIEHDLLPEYIRGIPVRLKALQEKRSSVLEVTEHTHIVSGGTDLYVQRAFSMKYERTTRILHRKISPAIREEQSEIVCAAQTSVEEFSRSEIIRSLIPRITEFMSLFGSTPIRNRATLAGNIVNASPIGDMTSLLLALDASLLLKEGDSVRKIPLRLFYKGYKQVEKKKNEIVDSIHIPKPVGNRRVNFEKVSRRRHLDIASVNSAMVIASEGTKLTEVHLTAGGVFATPLYLTRTSAFLSGRELTPSVITEADGLIQSEIKPISDARGSEEYKRLLIRQLFHAHLLTFFPELPLPKESL